MPDSNYYPPVGFYFSLAFTGISSDNDVAFQEASGISSEMDVQEVAEGGENRFKYKLPKTGKYSNLILKRGLMTKSSPLATWCQSTILSNLEKAITPKDITVTLLNQDGDKLMAWNFLRAYPVKWSISDLKSQENNLVVETLEFAYTYFEQK